MNLFSSLRTSCLIDSAHPPPAPAPCRVGPLLGECGPVPVGIRRMCSLNSITVFRIMRNSERARVSSVAVT